MKLKITLVLLMLTSISFAQLTYKSRDIIYNGGKKASPSEVRQLLAAKPELLDLYNKGKRKKSVGNIILASGIGMTVGSFVATYVGDSPVSPITFAGLGLVAVAIPVKIGYAKKIRTAVEGYNASTALNTFKIEEMSLCANEYGAGVRITF